MIQSEARNQIGDVVPVAVPFARLAVVLLATMALVACAAPARQVSNIVDDIDVRGCGDKIPHSLGPLDVAIVIDTSQSTGQPSGVDINRDGVVRRFQRNTTLDRGDSRLAAKIAALRPLLRNSKNRDIRFSLVTFAGPNVEKTSWRIRTTGSIRDSKLRVPLTSDLARLDAGLTAILDGGSDGHTTFSAGMQRGTRSLVADRVENRRRMLLLISDSSRPSWPSGVDLARNVEEVDPRMMSEAIMARHKGVVIHTFGLSPKAGAWRHEAIGQIAGATGGTYHPVDDPRELYCHFANALATRYRPTQAGWQKAFAEYREQEAAGSNSSVNPELPSAKD